MLYVGASNGSSTVDMSFFVCKRSADTDREIALAFSLTRTEMLICDSSTQALETSIESSILIPTSFGVFPGSFEARDESDLTR